MAKGGSYEREICKKLSLWWTSGRTNDVFWRTAGSGARATVRRKQGKTTFGQVGDVQATDPIGQPLIDMCVVEIKKGYSKHSIIDIIDSPSYKLEYYVWITKVRLEAKQSKTPYWFLIHRRTRRNEMIYMPWNLYIKCFNNMYPAIITRFEEKRIAGFLLTDFLKEADPEQLVRVHETKK